MHFPMLCVCCIVFLLYAIKSRTGLAGVLAEQLVEASSARACTKTPIGVCGSSIRA